MTEEKEKQRQKATLRRKQEEVSYDVRSRLLGLVHACLSLFLAIKALILDGGVLKEDGVLNYTVNSQRMVTVSAAFFLWDLGLCALHFRTFGAGLLMHAGVCCLMYSIATLFHVLHYYGCMFLLWESSTLFLHFKWALEQYELKGSPVYILNGLTFMLVFFMVRIVLGNFVFFELYQQVLPMFIAPETSIMYRIGIVCILVGSICLNLLNIFWLTMMMKFAT